MIKNLAVWKRKTKNKETYLSIAVELENGEKESINVFLNKKTKDTQPDFKYWKRDDKLDKKTEVLPVETPEEDLPF